MQTRPLHLCSISCSLLTKTRMLKKKNSNKNYPDVKQRALLKCSIFSRFREVWDWAATNNSTLRKSAPASDWLFTARENSNNNLDPNFYLLFLPLRRGERERRAWDRGWISIDQRPRYGEEGICHVVSIERVKNTLRLH